jgi:hypothetical protein
MKRPSFFALLLLAAVFSGGCTHFHVPFFGKKTTPPGPMGPRDSNQVGTDTERDFRARWVEKRANELVSQGQSADGAHAQALSEFQQKFSALKIVQHP